MLFAIYMLCEDTGSNFSYIYLNLFSYIYFNFKVVTYLLSNIFAYSWFSDFS